jgi:hypothetical protein
LELTTLVISQILSLHQRYQNYPIYSLAAYRILMIKDNRLGHTLSCKIKHEVNNRHIFSEIARVIATLQVQNHILDSLLDKNIPEWYESTSYVKKSFLHQLRHAMGAYVVDHSNMYDNSTQFFNNGFIVSKELNSNNARIKNITSNSITMTWNIQHSGNKPDSIETVYYYDVFIQAVCDRKIGDLVCLCRDKELTGTVSSHNLIPSKKCI